MMNLNHPTRRIRLGIIVPSSNTVLEPITQKIVASIRDPTLNVTVHFARFRVTKIELSPAADSQFVLEAILSAAQLLADAQVDVIGWSGTSASWLGFSTDEILCTNIEKRTGIPATTSVLAMNDILRLGKFYDLGLITPYSKELTAAIRNSYEAAGFPICAKRSQYAGLTTNFDFAALQEKELDEMVDFVVRNGAANILVMCTNVDAAERVRYWESHYKILVLDSVTTVIHGMLKILGLQVDYEYMKEWGSVFSQR